VLVKCLYNYLWRHHCIHHLIYYSSIYRPFPWNSTCWLPSLPTYLQYEYLIISHLYKRYSFPSESHTTTPLCLLKSSMSLILKQILIAISIEVHMTYSVSELGCQQLSLVPSKYTVHLHYTSPSRCSNIHTIDELRWSLLLRYLYNYLQTHHCIHHIIYYASSYRPFHWNSSTYRLPSLPTCYTNKTK
jgi:hypothetical protein